MALDFRRINALPSHIRDFLFLKLIPNEIFLRFNIDPVTLKGPSGYKCVRGYFPKDKNLALIEIRLDPQDEDPIFQCQLSLEEHFRSVNLDWIVMNDITKERFNVDKTPEGKEALCGILQRNMEEEIKAMQAGLAPGMVRPGLGLFGKFLRCLEDFTSFLGLNTITLEALFYHNAIMFERHGFTYLKGLKMMQTIGKEFRPQGKLYLGLDGSTPFRQRGMEASAKTRSWAIHDGLLKEVLGLEWTPPWMYKLVSKHHGIDTFWGA
jgi:hypothetical protein